MHAGWITARLMWFARLLAGLDRARCAVLGRGRVESNREMCLARHGLLSTACCMLGTACMLKRQAAAHGEPAG